MKKQTLVLVEKVIKKVAVNSSNNQSNWFCYESKVPSQLKLKK